MPPVERHDLGIGPDDESLVRDAMNGDHAAFGELVRRHDGRVYSFLLRRCVFRADAEDCAQESLLLAWRKLGTFRPERGTRFTTWLLAIAGNVAATRARGRPASRPLNGSEDVDRRTPDPSSSLAKLEGRERLWALVDRTLDPEQRAAVWLRYAEGLSVGETAIALGRTQVSVRMMLFRARRRLLAELSYTAEANLSTAADMKEALHVHQA